MRPSALFLFLASCCLTTVYAQSGGSDLPDIGNPAGAVVTRSDEYSFGRQIVQQLHQQNQIFEDPEVTEYLNSIGSRIAVQAGDDGQRFEFFAVRDTSINAFALPGGFIGVNQGLLLATTNESQLASVLAHETAHVTQRHIARSIRAQGQQGMASMATILAAILIGAIGGGGADAMQGAIAMAQGTAMQQQLNFTRANENEADRVGIGFLAAAGFDPQAMPDFFETLGRRYGLAEGHVPALLQDHPVTSERIAESRGRAGKYPRPASLRDTLSYSLVRERLRVLGTAPGEDPVPYYAKLAKDEGALTVANQYGKGVALIQAGRPSEAVRVLGPLAAKHEDVILLQIALAQAQVAAGLQSDGLSTFESAVALFPRNVPLTIRYAEALMATGRAREAHTILLDLFNNVVPTPDQIHLIALAASAAGETGDAYFYMGEYQIASGSLGLAVQQLELALATPNLTSIQRERYKARLSEIREHLLEARAMRKVSNPNGG